jgi:enoyl-CoA hydratase/carnithine racemase
MSIPEICPPCGPQRSCTFDGTTHHDFPRLVEDIAFDSGNRVVVLTGSGDSFIASIDGPSLGDITKPMGADVLFVEGRRGVQRLADLEIPIIAAVNGPASVHSEYALLADVVIAADTTVFSDMPHLAFGIAPGDGLFVVWEEVLGLNRARHLEITQGSFTAQEALGWGAVAEVVPLGQVLPRAQELAEQMTQRPHLTNKYLAVVFRQRISRRLAEGTLAGMALESLTAANLAYLQQGSPGHPTGRCGPVGWPRGIDFGKLPLPMSPPASVVKAALRGLGRRPLVIPGP